ncbi:hypothetical protein RHSIM_Rhsim01G0119200 [Rhododendron simsii]|uniref:Endonuclease/exonuclease/phosphatase domain-containing protein n=1 Tax=Rhododendron simsii TaxID=118357 RepID=A0A834HI23_RHOSS|nr:hypothetical protein RHSIM_Rhsim01G0119200 [Rhododendron simsii]
MRRLQWDSNNVDADIRGGTVIPTLVSPLKISPSFMGQMSGPRNAAVLKITKVQIDGTEKAQFEGSIGSPKDIMEKDCSNPTDGEIQKKLSEGTQTLGREENSAKLPGKGKEIIEKGEVVGDSKKPSSRRGYKKRQSYPMVRGGRGRGKGEAKVEQTKRKFEVALVEVEIAEEMSQTGGLAILWKRGLNVNLVRRSNFFIEVLIKDEESNHECHLINLYASSIDSVRKSQWEDLQKYRQQSTEDWVLWGDFNDILWTDEKKGGRRREVWSLKVFRDFVASLGAVDLGFNGYPFTWSNRRGGDGQVKERLDRVLVAPGWRLKYDRARVQHLFAVRSNHAVLLLDTNPPKFTGYRQFLFDSRWANDPASYDTVCKGWQVTIQGSKMFEVFHKVRNTRKELRVWSKVKNFNARKKINELQGKLKAIGENRVSSDKGQICVFEKELVTWLCQTSEGVTTRRSLIPVLVSPMCGGVFKLIKQRERQGQLKGIQICRVGPYISHLLFADDSLVFCKATREESGDVKEVLDTYRQASGQLINNLKSSILFSSNTETDQRQEYKDILRKKKKRKPKRTMDKSVEARMRRREQNVAKDNLPVYAFMHADSNALQQMPANHPWLQSTLFLFMEES